MSKLGEHLAALRERVVVDGKPLSQRALADRLAHIDGVHQGSLSKWERDVLQPSAGQLEAILIAVGASEDDRAEALALAVEAARRTTDGPPTLQAAG